ncbi:MAG: methyltransferase domain-containing protein [Saprospiraceae bacterium]|nr:methyltransferase domain-containing protein [Saprospiraceae bacterium]
MKANKEINRDGQEATCIFDHRSLSVDYRHLPEVLKRGMLVLDVGCGTGAMSRDMATLVGPDGKVIGIDNTSAFIESGRKSYGDMENLELVHSDLFQFNSDLKFDLITSARMLQWLSDPEGALKIMMKLLRKGGMISILDYNHEDLEWNPAPPASMLDFYAAFLQWKADAGMDNRIADHLPSMMARCGLAKIEVINSDEVYRRDRSDFATRAGIWAKVAGSKQMVDEGYLDPVQQKLVIEEYLEWVEDEAVSMTMKLNEVRGIKQSE